MKTPSERLVRLVGVPIAVLAMAQAAGGQIYHEADVNITHDLCVGSVSCWGAVDDPPDLHIRSVVPQIGLFSDSSGAWRIEANRTGFKEFLIREVPSVGTARTVMQINPGAPANSLFVDATGRVGLGTGAPTDALTIAFDSPSLKWIDTNGNKEWNIDANDAGFSIVEDGADTRMTVDTGGDVGIGVLNPGAPLHVARSDGTAGLVVQESNGSQILRTLLEMINNGPVNTKYVTGGSTWRQQFQANAYALTKDGTGGNEMTIMASTGDMTVRGSLTTGGPACSSGCDEVLEPNFPLESIQDHAEEMWELRHLPAIGVTGPDRPINVTETVGGILNELEKAHIYIEQLHERLGEKDQDIAALANRLDHVEALVNELTEGNSSPETVVTQGSELEIRRNCRN